MGVITATSTKRRGFLTWREGGDSEGMIINEHLTKVCTLFRF